MVLSRQSIWTGRQWRLLAAMMGVTSLAVPGRAEDGAFERASAGMVQRYIQAWSGPTDAALAYMDQVYPSHVFFYGKDLPHEALMNLKRRFAARWPERALAVRPGSVNVVCDAGHICTVQAIYEWHYRSLQREAASSGAARLKLQLRDGTTILAEDGNVISPERTATLVKQTEGTPAPPPLEEKTKAPAMSPAPAAEAGPQQEDLGAQWQQTVPAPNDVVALRQEYAEHGTDTKWITAWLEQKRAFSGKAIVSSTPEEHAAAGSADDVRTVGFTSAAGAIACINPDGTRSLKPGEKVNLQGVITIFIDNVMYLERCSIEPG